MNQGAKKHKFLGILLIAALIAGLVGWALFGGGAQAPSGGDEANPQELVQQQAVESSGEGEGEADSASEAVIMFTENGFSPEELEVSEGTRVTVRNESTQRVQFSSDDHPTHRLNIGMNLRTLSPGESDSFIAEPVGTHGFHDHIDDSFIGTLIVTE